MGKDDAGVENGYLFSVLYPLELYISKSPENYSLGMSDDNSIFCVSMLIRSNVSLVQTVKYSYCHYMLPKDTIL